MIETEVPESEKTVCDDPKLEEDCEESGDLLPKSEETAVEHNLPTSANILNLEQGDEVETEVPKSEKTVGDDPKLEEDCEEGGDLLPKSEETVVDNLPTNTDILKLEQGDEVETEVSSREEETEGDIPTLERQCVEEFRNWIETEATFYGRTDEEFLLIFLRGCKFDMNKSKKKLTKYYENRKKVPEWWANRDISHFEEVLNLKVMTLLIDQDPHLPSVAITKISNVGQNSSLFEKFMKANSITLDLILRRQNSQLNGLLWIIDFKAHPLWLMAKFFNPTRLYNVLQGYTMATPLRINGIHVINTPLMGRALWQMAKPMCPVKISKRIHFYGSDWLLTLKDRIDERLLPEEYGGINGKMSDHEDAFIEEIYAFSDYIVDDNKYGFK